MQFYKFYIFFAQYCLLHIVVIACGKSKTANEIWGNMGKYGQKSHIFTTGVKKAERQKGRKAGGKAACPPARLYEAVAGIVAQRACTL